MAAANGRMPPPTLANGDGDLDDLGNDFEALLRDSPRQRRGKAAAAERERELNIIRSGSAPPSVEGSRNAVSSLFGNLHAVDMNGYSSGATVSEEDMRSHPAYLSYYYSNGNMNPRLPPPALSKEDWRMAQRFQVGTSAYGKIGERRQQAIGSGASDGNSCSLFTLQPDIQMGRACGGLTEPMMVPETSSARQPAGEWVESGGDSFIGLPGNGMGMKTRSFADVLQENLGQPPPVANNVSRLAIGNDQVGEIDVPQAHFQCSLEAMDKLKSEEGSSSRLVNIPRLGSPASQSFASVLGSSLVRSTTPELQAVGKSSNTCLPTFGGRDDFPSSNASTSAADKNDMASALSDLLHDGNGVQEAFLRDISGRTNYVCSISYDSENFQQQNVNKPEVDSSSVSSIPVLSHGLVAEGSNLFMYNYDSQINHGLTNVDFSGSHANNFLSSQRLPSLTNGQIYGGNIMSTGYGLAGENHSEYGMQDLCTDPLFSQHFQPSSVPPNAAASFSDPYSGRKPVDFSNVSISEYQKACFEAMQEHHTAQYEIPFVEKSGGFNGGYYGTCAFNPRVQYPSNSVSSFIFPSVDQVSPVRQGNKHSQQFPPKMRSAGISMGSWNSEYRARVECFPSSLLEECKSSRSKNFELSSIVGHAVEFSVDQFGSRFIQQKLETASLEGKNKIFPEIFSHARALMTDVFGNYVIQKFLEHGDENHRKQLASQLTGHVLSLSLHMYGCRVIQKALEVTDVDQQTQLVSELQGSVMRCVCDQNGNHVIQKCIERVPQDRIQFILSAFHGHVVPLSVHPYGCRVIQRVLEHCSDAKSQSLLMDEILQAVFSLAQDQYGNYVVQHVLQRGSRQERSAIIDRFAGQIEILSQQKFASNVVEKCLTFGTPEERRRMVNEMLGSTDENEALVAMMKDQFGNYVVQTALETCDDRSREVILSRIKAHVSSLKKYTYWKHISSRVEKVIAAGEKRRVGGHRSPSSFHRPLNRIGVSFLLKMYPELPRRFG
ncbi:unnamed protein product [Spirodela intermedia]|uniref:PUM-HD domain-containing protein n=1 Tax=Spirodela intermedia TaxID=51605 RepID=A0A7I8KQ13_SPIIN|nr:unnamed protein product [Spirodela intermedia]